MDLLLRGGRVIDTSGRAVLDAAADVLIRDGRIVEIGRGLQLPSDGRGSGQGAGRVSGQVIDVSDLLVCPGLVDLHVHFREPGHEYKEDIASGCASAAAGGFTAVCCMPNTNPVNDCRSVTDLITRRAREVGTVAVYPIGAISRQLAGRELAEIGEMCDGGIVAVSDDGRPVMNAGLMRRALEYARTFDLPVVQHAEDLDLAEGGIINEGEVSTRIGVRGQPSQAESIMVARDIELSDLTGARYHVAHVSAGRSVELIREAKRRGLPVSCEVTPHHFTLSDEACAGYDTTTNVKPPLRSGRDVAALKEAMADGTIDCIATDHAPHSDVEKEVEFDCASPGMLGLETAVPLTLALVREGVIDLPRAVRMLTSAPASLFRLDRHGAGSLAVGGPADLCVIDVNRRFRIDREDMQSKSRNTPFHDVPVQGQCVLTICRGQVIHDLDRRWDSPVDSSSDPSDPPERGRS